MDCFLFVFLVWAAFLVLGQVFLYYTENDFQITYRNGGI